ncbi:MAG: hypothetical protein LBS97_07105 [Treponema sp.]|jgi:hypothetical protein|nr:hypothetical protein [Treponema sp.]
MTIQVRNRFVIAFLLLSILSIGITGGFALRMSLTGEMQEPSQSILAAVQGTAPAFFAYRFYAVVCSVCFLVISVPVITCLMIFNFEKTQAQEYVFFMFFLGACLTEISRLFIPVFGLWENNSSFLISSARILLFGRMLAPASFLFPVLFSSARQNQDTERNVIALVALSGVFAVLTPVNTAHILPNCTVETGQATLFTFYVAIMYILSFLSLAIMARHGGREQRLMTLGYAILFAGYLILTGALSFGAFVVGAVFFVTGVYAYLGNLHKLYMWN